MVVNIEATVSGGRDGRRRAYRSLTMKSVPSPVSPWLMP
jgi:hypothetical protein